MAGMEKLFDDFQQYIDTKIQIVKLEVEEKISVLLTSAVLVVSIIFLGTMMLLFLSIALAEAINTALNSRSLGFLIVGLLFLFICIAAVLSKKMIHKMLFNIIVQSMDKKN